MIKEMLIAARKELDRQAQLDEAFTPYVGNGFHEYTVSIDGEIDLLKLIVAIVAVTKEDKE